MYSKFIKQAGISALSIILLVSFCSSALAAGHSKLTTEQKLQIWLKAPAKQKWNAKQMRKQIGEVWWRLAMQLPLDQAEKMWPATLATHAPYRMADMAHLLATKQKNYALAKKYWENKLETPRGARSKEARLYKRARKARYQLTRILLYYIGKKDKTLSQEKINEAAMGITGGKIQVARYGTKLLKHLTGHAKATLLLNAVYKYGDNPSIMNQDGGLLKQLKAELKKGNINHLQAIDVAKRAKQRTDKKLAKTKPSDKHYKALKKYDQQVTSVYNELKKQ